MRTLRFAYIAIVLFLLGCGSPQLAEYTSGNRKIDSTVTGNALESTVAPYRVEMHRRMNTVIGYSDSALVSYAPESPLGNFVADVVFESGMNWAVANDVPCSATNTFCLLNFGGIRSAINAGAITTSTIYELMPFDNTVVIVELEPTRIEQLLGAVLENKGQPVSNVNMTLGTAEKQLLVAGESYRSDHNLFVITSDYLANGGDRMNFFLDPVRRWDTGILVRQLLIDYISIHERVNYVPVQGRIKLEP